MTDAKIAELRALLEKATPAPWNAEFGDRVDAASRVDGVAHDLGEDDAALIAAARNELPALLDWIERARKVLRAVERAGFSRMRGDLCPSCDEADGHRSDCELAALLAD